MAPVGAFIPRSRLRIWFRETGSTVLSRVSLLISKLRLNLVLTYGIPLEFSEASIYLFLLCYMISHQSHSKGPISLVLLSFSII